MADPAAFTRGELFTREQEGCRLVAYTDTLGVWTCGYGCTGPGIGPGTVWTQREADHEFTVRYAAAKFGARADLGSGWFDELSETRQAALCDMAYQLGAHGLAGFKDMLAAIRAGDWLAVVAAARASLWSEQVPNRARAVEALWASGEFAAAA